MSAPDSSSELKRLAAVSTRWLGACALLSAIVAVLVVLLVAPIVWNVTRPHANGATVLAGVLGMALQVVVAAASAGMALLFLRIRRALLAWREGHGSLDAALATLPALLYLGAATSALASVGGLLDRLPFLAPALGFGR